jgi:hypothetical protein
MFLSPSGITEVLPALMGHLQAGGRIISYQFELPVKSKYLKHTGSNGNLFVYALP